MCTCILACIPVYIDASRLQQMHARQMHATTLGRTTPSVPPYLQEGRLLALVRSANDSSDDVRLYSNRAHGFLSKCPTELDWKSIMRFWVGRFGTSTLSAEVETEAVDARSRSILNASKAVSMPSTKHNITLPSVEDMNTAAASAELSKVHIDVVSPSLPCADPDHCPCVDRSCGCSIVHPRCPGPRGGDVYTVSRALPASSAFSSSLPSAVPSQKAPSSQGVRQLRQEGDHHH